MAYTHSYTFVPTTADDPNRLVLHWDNVETQLAVASEQVWNSESLQYETSTVPPVSATIVGAKAIYPTLSEFYAVEPQARVVNNIVERPRVGSQITTPIAIPTSGGTRVLTTKEVQGFNVTLSLPGLYKLKADNSGYEATHAVSVGIYYRVYNPAIPDALWTAVHTNYIISSEPVRAEILRTIKHNEQDVELPLAKYEVLVVRNTEDHTGNMDYADDVYIKEITEILYSSIAYNHTALLGVKIRATDQLSGSLPTVTALVKGIKVKVPSNLLTAYQSRYVNGSYNTTAIDAAYSGPWDGQMSAETVHTDNPVWCLYDLLTNERYGLADYYKIASNKLGLMRANFYIMSKYCDAGLSYVDDSGATPVNKMRPRFALNIVLDQSKTAAEWIGQIASIMRATVFYNEGIFWIDIDREKPVSQLFTMSSIKDYTQTSTSYRAIPNSYEVQWINPLTNYEVDSFKLDSYELQTNARIEERKKALQLIGVTVFDQAKSLAKYALLAGERRNKFVTFKTGTKGLRCSITDVIAIQHDVPRWGYGGKVVSYDSNTKTVRLSAPIEMNPVLTYAISFDSSLSGVREFGLLTQDGDAITEVVLSGTGIGPDAGDEYIIYISGAIAKFKVNSIKRDSDETCEIGAVLYEPTLYNECDSTGDLGAYVTGDYSLVANPRRSSVQGVYATTNFYQTTTGVWTSGVDVFYEPPKTTFWRAAQVHYAVVGTGTYISGEINSSGRFYFADVPAGDYQVVVTSVYTEGKQTISDALSDYTSHPWASVTVSEMTPNDLFLQGVSGLSLENQLNDGTFIGKDCIVVWRKPIVIGDEVAAAGSETSGAATTTTDSWFSNYIVEVTGVDGAVKRRSNVYTERFVYTYEMNYQDSMAQDGDADRQFTVSVTIVDKLGRKSATKSIDCYNPAPAKMLAV